MRQLERCDETSDGELEMDGELFGEPIDALAKLAAIETHFDDLGPWQRLGDVLGQITGDATSE